jgi:ATP-binding protein involved in chromosome partitioning
MIDPRTSIIAKRTEHIGRIVVFAGGKGGVGKSACSVVTALHLARSGKRVGLFDADFTGASAHIFLGTDLGFPEEEHGVVPTDVGYGLRFMSAAAYTGERGFPLRGKESTDVFLELFAITRWNELDYLILDMPPGLGDELLDVVRYLDKKEAVLVTIPSLISARVVARLARFFRDEEVPIAGLIENMVPGSDESGGGYQQQHGPELGQGPSHGRGCGGDAFPEYTRVVEGMNAPLISSVPFFADFEASIGNPETLLRSRFATAIRPVAVALEPDLDQ